jgi:hypothetical protein
VNHIFASVHCYTPPLAVWGGDKPLLTSAVQPGPATLLRLFLHAARVSDILHLVSPYKRARIVPFSSARCVRHYSYGFERPACNCRVQSNKQLKGDRLFWPIVACPVPGRLCSWERLSAAAKRGYSCHSRCWSTTQQPPAKEAAEGLEASSQARE